MVPGGAGTRRNVHAKGCAEYGTKVVGGVTPGKGGTTHEGWPVFDTVHEAVEKTGANVTVIFVPPPFGRRCDSRGEGCGRSADRLYHRGDSDSGHGEGVGDAEDSESRLIGPNCPGVVSPGKAKVGIVPGQIRKEGSIGIVSRSGTLTYEAVYQLTSAGLGSQRRLGLAAIRLSARRMWMR